MRCVLLQLSVTDAEPIDARVERAAALVRKQAGADLVVLPELWHTGAFASRRWADAAEPLDGPLAAAMAAAARDAGVTLHAGSFVERVAEPRTGAHGLTNTSLVVGADGERLALYRKIHRFGHGEGESALIDAGDEVVVVDLPVGGRTVRTGLSTCYDLRFPELYRAQVADGAEMLVIPAGWPMARVEHWRALLVARAVENQCVVLACGTADTHARTEMAGHSMVIGPDGTVVAEAGAGEEALVVDVDLDTVARLRESFPVLEDQVLNGVGPEEKG